MLVPVVVVHHGAPAWCRSAARAIASSAGVDAAIVVVDNSGDLDGGLPAQCTVITPLQNLGFAAGANFGIDHVLATRPSTDRVVVCAHDFHPQPETLDALTRLLDDRTDVGIVGPSLTGPTPESGGDWNGWAARRRPLAHEPEFEIVDWVSGTCMMLRVACLREVGGFDQRLGSYVEDVDLCLRARDHGWVVGVAAATGHGLGSVSDDRTRLAARNAVLVVAKRRGRAAAAVAAARYAARAVRSTLGAAMPWRSADRRRESVRFAAGNWRAIGSLLRDGALGSMIADPGGHHRF